jgi:hypothetical protein
MPQRINTGAVAHHGHGIVGKHAGHGATNPELEGSADCGGAGGGAVRAVINNPAAPEIKREQRGSAPLVEGVIAPPPRRFATNGLYGYLNTRSRRTDYDSCPHRVVGPRTALI